MRAPSQNLSTIKSLAKQNYPGREGLCLQAIRTACGAPGMGGVAKDAYDRVPESRRHTGKPPAGYPAFWSGGTPIHLEGRGTVYPGHVVLGAGGSGSDDCYSTDFARPGRIDLVSIAAITKSWTNLRYLGWTEEINGIRITPPAVAAPTQPIVSVKVLNARRADKKAHNDVGWVKRWLYAEGYRGMSMTGSGAHVWGTGTQAAYDQYRRQKMGLSGTAARGSVGLTSLTHLAKRHDGKAVA